MRFRGEARQDGGPRGRFTGRQLTTLVVAVALAIIAFPVGVFAATGNLVNITDPVYKSHKARVDSSGRLKVGDGSGALTVDGTVYSRPLPPARSWSVDLRVDNNYAPLAGPTSSPINLTSVTFEPYDQPSLIFIFITQVASGVTTCASGSYTGSYVGKLWELPGLSAGTAFTTSFPTPLRVEPPTGTKYCLYVEVSNYSYVMASGYLGG